ncbi:MAG: hypothetical protein ACLFVR_01255 [Thiohalospira sp.]
MKTRISHIKVYIFSFLFLVIMGGIIFNATFFLHTHRIADGKIIVHAHPYNKNSEKNLPDTQHQHNKIELQVIQSLDFFILADEIDESFNPGNFLIAKYNIPKCYYKPSHLNNSINNRAPPSII